MKYYLRLTFITHYESYEPIESFQNSTTMPKFKLLK